MRFFCLRQQCPKQLVHTFEEPLQSYLLHRNLQTRLSLDLKVAIGYV